MNLQPVGDKIIVKRLDAEETTSGGIILPDGAREKPQQGRVLSTGDGRLLPDGSRAAHLLQEGDRVLFTEWAGSTVVVDEQELLIMSEEDVLAVLD